MKGVALGAIGMAMSCRLLARFSEWAGRTSPGAECMEVQPVNRDCAGGTNNPNFIGLPIR
jgi:hypothetical protein